MSYISIPSEKVVQLVQQGQKLMALKVYRDETGYDLSTCKDVIDEVERQLKETALRETLDMQPDDEVIQLLKRGEKLMAVKVYKEKTGCDLILAKNYIDELYEQYAPKPEEPKVSNYKDWEASLKNLTPKTTQTTKQPISQTTKQPTTQTTKQPINQTTNGIGDHYDKGEPQGCLGMLLLPTFAFIIYLFEAYFMA